MDPELNGVEGENGNTPTDLQIGAPETGAESVVPSLESRFDEMPSLDLLHIDEMEPPSPSEEVPSSPVTPMPAPPDTSLRGNRMSKASKPTKPSGKNGESMRARAEEVNSGSKLVPKIEDAPGDFFGLEIELPAWFENSNVNLEEWVASLEEEHTRLHGVPGSLNHSSPGGGVSSPSATIKEELYQLLIHRSAYNSDACIVLVERAVETKSRWLSLAKKVVSDSIDPDFDEQTLVFVCLCAWHSSKHPPLLDEGLDIVVQLLHRIAEMRWFVELDDEEQTSTSQLTRLFKLLRVAILATLGDSDQLKETQADVWKSYGMELPENEDEFASPINYAEFMEEIYKRYPACIAAQDDAEHNLGKRLRRTKRGGNNGNALDPNNGNDEGFDPADPRELVNNQSSVMPYVPQSIIEACEVYRSKVRTTPSILQLSEMQHQIGDDHKTKDKDDKANSDCKSVQVVKEIYRRTLKIQKSVVKVAVDYIMHVGKTGPGPHTHAAVASIYLLLRWFGVGHVLMFEHLSALLFDSQFHLVTHLFCGGHPQIASYVLAPYVLGEVFWSLVTGPNTFYDGPILNWSPSERPQLSIPHYNKFNLQTFSDLVGISRLIVTGKTQRLLVVAEIPVDPIKNLFSIYESNMWLQILLYLKAQVPFTGKRWRYLNMELISAIYLYCPSRIDDNWLSGGDVTQAVRNAPTEEATLRELVQRYNALIQK